MTFCNFRYHGVTFFPLVPNHFVNMIHTESLLHLLLYSGQSVRKSDNTYVYSTPPIFFRQYNINLFCCYFLSFYIVLSFYFPLSAFPFLSALKNHRRSNKIILPSQKQDRHQRLPSSHIRIHFPAEKCVSFFLSNNMTGKNAKSVIKKDFSFDRKVCVFWCA